MTATYPSLAEHTVLITGGASGIGADLVRAFAAQGASVAFLDIQTGAGTTLATETGTLFLQADVTDIPALSAAITKVKSQLGPITTLINNAANDRREGLEQTTLEDWDLSQNTNLRPHFFAAQAVRDQMAQAGGGAIINLSSVVWKLGGKDMIPYATAKSAIIGLTKSLAHALGPDNIRVNAIEPGAVMTPRQRALWYPTEADVKTLTDRQLLNHIIEGTDIAAMALFLASDQAKSITNQTFVVDAGLT
jgi:NAD(P)-dependent dehydrogenase (short-subunit alcohol dehydrogenase family)